MPLMQLTTFKTIPYEDRDEEYSNVYTYRVDPYPDLAARRDIIRAVIDLEQTIHSDLITGWRGETRPMDETQTPAVPQASDGEATGIDGQGDFAHVDEYYPQWVVMFQQRVAKRAWIRKYFHSYAISPFVDISENNIYRWNTNQIDAFQASYGDNITRVTYANEGTADATAVLSTPSGNDADPVLNIDNRIRIHELKY